MPWSISARYIHSLLPSLYPSTGGVSDKCSQALHRELCFTSHLVARHTAYLVILRLRGISEGGVLCPSTCSLLHPRGTSFTHPWRCKLAPERVTSRSKIDVLNVSADPPCNRHACCIAEDVRLRHRNGCGQLQKAGLCCDLTWCSLRAHLFSRISCLLSWFPPIVAHDILHQLLDHPRL